MMHGNEKLPGNQIVVFEILHSNSSGIEFVCLSVSQSGFVNGDLEIRV